MTKSCFTPKQRKYIEILANPGENRNQGEIAQELRVARQTLYRWRSRPGFWDAVGELIRDHSDRELANVWGALIRRAKHGDVQAQRLYFQLRGELVEKQEQKIGFDGPPQIEVIIDGRNEYGDK